MKSRSAWFKNGTEKARKLKNEKSKRLIKSAILGNADIFVVNEEFRALIHRVREDRKYHSLCVSAQNNADIPALLEQVIETECYKKDYEEHTRTMLYTPCNYEEAITGLKKIIDSGMFGKDEEYEKNTVHISVSSASKIASYKEYRIFAMPEHDKIDYNEAKTYRKEREGMLRPNQWEDLIVRVYI